LPYNRCIGTRYCMNNCPYKVRRFNFFNFNLDIPDTQKMMQSERHAAFRGVVENARTACSASKTRRSRPTRGSRARRRRRRQRLPAGVPARAITFGDIRDEKSAVSRARGVDRNYALLAQLGTHPRTRFLGKLRNPNPELKG
jgi:molybdopterin-containing oxidoreductase family iron-sulfur binding subunit